jgi:membrane protein implicated in regulation of membrane protease activity
MKGRSRRVEGRTRPIQREAPVKANAGMRYDLWFAEDALYKVDILGQLPLGLAFALPAIPASALLALVGPLRLGLNAPPVLDSAALLLVSVVIAYLVPTFVVRRRRRLDDMTFVQAKAGVGTKKISWDRVKRIALTKRTTVRLELRRGRSTEVVRAGLSQNDANRLKSIIVQSKVGRSFEFRDRILR